MLDRTIIIFVLIIFIFGWYSFFDRTFEIKKEGYDFKKSEQAFVFGGDR